MKIAVLRSECSFTRGGAERYAANFCRELCELGHKVVLLAEVFDPEVHPAIEHVPIKVVRTTSSQRNRSFHENCQKALANLDVDAVVALSRSFPADAFRVSDPLHCVWMKLRYPNPLRRFLERLNPRHRTILNIEASIMDPSNTRLIVTNSKLSKSMIGEHYNYPADRIHVIYNGVDLAQFEANLEVRDDDDIRLLFVGQDFKRKGLKPVLQALADVRKKGHPCTLRVVGRDKPAPYQKLAEELGVSEHVTFDGPTREIQKAYRTADLFVFPSLYDPFANVCLESLACGLPVLTTTTNGSSEVVTENETGYVVEGATSRLADDLADRISRFCGLTKEERGAMRRRSRTTAESYTIEANTRAFVERLSETTS